MPTNQSQTAADDAVGALSNLGLTSYEAKCYVALLRLGRGTAREVADVSTVPRSRVYDAMKSLRGQGFVDIEYSNPRAYRPVSLERALELISDRRIDHERALREAAANLPTPDDGADAADGVWTVSKHDHVHDRESRLLGDETDRVVAYARDDTLTHPFLRDLGDLCDRDIDVTLLVDTRAAKERAGEELCADADVAAVDAAPGALQGDGEGGYIARAFCVDDEAAMVASAAANERTGTRRESAVWCRSNGPGVGFVRLVSGALADADC